MDKHSKIDINQEIERLKSSIFAILNQDEFDSFACQIFRLQYNFNLIYKGYVDLLNIKPDDVKKVEDIPFMPISLFKNKIIICGEFNHKLVFYSSGTTDPNPSKHFIVDVDIYHNSFINSFNLFYGNPSDYCFLALLPGYLERKGSSLIYMVNELMKRSGHPDNGFFLNEFELLKKKINKIKKNNHKYILIGVTYALLDFANFISMDLSDGIIMETGGMKGTRKEMLKAEVHQILKSRFGIEKVHSEYGMTELLSQAYSKGDGLYICPPWMKVMIRDIYDPLSYVADGNSGGINIIDLANIYSCSFIETKDLGKITQNGEFEILGRFDDSEIRGCNLMVN